MCEWGGEVSRGGVCVWGEGRYGVECVCVCGRGEGLGEVSRECVCVSGERDGVR